jgi:long-chain acyl-CoA synthetase
MPERFESLVDMQERSCERHAANRLFGTKREGTYGWMTYAEFAQRVDHFRSALAQLGILRGDKIAVISGNRSEWAVGAFATYGLGAQWVPMYESQRAEEWAFVLRDSGAKILLTSTEHIHQRTAEVTRDIPQVAHKICFDAPPDASYGFTRQLEFGAADPIPSVRPRPHDVAGIMYTSGTTGEPKGVVLSHGNIVSNINAIHQMFAMDEGDVSCSFLPWAHSFGQTCELHVLLSMGAAIGLAVSPQTLMENLREIRPTVLFAVPRVFNRIYAGLHKRLAEEPPLRRAMFDKGLAVARLRRETAESGGARSLWLDAQHALLTRLVFSKIQDRFGGRLRWAISGGAALSLEVAQFIDDVGITVFEGYGLTETSPIATTNSPDGRRLGTIGRPLPGVEIFICDAQGNVLPADTDGEIVVVGPNVMQGYHKRPDLTDEVIFELDGLRAFRTGDMGRRTVDGFIVLTGRLKEQYKLENGKYVVPTPLEEKITLSPYVLQAFVYGENRAYNVCLLVPDFEAVSKWARTQGVAGRDPHALVENEAVRRLIGGELDRIGADFRAFERPRRWTLLAEEFTVESALLTPKLGVKRAKVLERYRGVLEDMYRSL